MNKTAAIFGFTGVLCSLALGAGAAQAQTTRSWVSGLGDDANPCSRTAPCKTFAGAYSKTTASGEIDCLDPGGFGSLTIGKALVIDCTAAGGIGGILAPGLTGIVVNAGANDSVSLIGLEINGDNYSPGANGIQINSASHVTIADCIVYGFTTNGILVQPSTSGVRVDIVRAKVFDNAGNGILFKPTGGASVRGTIEESAVLNNGTGASGGDGIMANDNANTTAGSIKLLITNTQSAHNVNGNGFGAFSSAGGVAEVVIDGGMASDNSTGVGASGGNATVRFTRTSLTAGTAISNSGGTVVSYSTNVIDGAVNGTLTTVASQ